MESKLIKIKMWYLQWTCVFVFKGIFEMILSSLRGGNQRILYSEIKVLYSRAFFKSLE